METSTDLIGSTEDEMHILLVALMLVQLPAGADSTSYARYNRFTQYDAHFSKYSKRYFGVGFDWRYFKAQAIAESNLRADARSALGATGVMQIMPATYEEIRRRHGYIAGPVEQPRWNIAAGIWYDRQNFRMWRADRPFLERLKFMFGSYNAGRGNILQAQRAALRQGLNGTLWSSIEQHLPEVTGGHSRETVTYVSRILDIKGVLD